MARISRGNHFLSGFANQDYLEDFVLGSRTSKTPVTNIAENEQRFKVDMAIPGYSREDLSIRRNESNLIVSGIRKKTDIENAEEFQQQEFDYSSFKKKFELPDHAEKDNISAKYKDGILQITIPKTEQVDTDESVILIN